MYVTSSQVYLLFFFNFTDVDINCNSTKTFTSAQPEPSSPPESDVMLYRSPIPIPTSHHPNNVEYSNVQQYQNQHDTSDVSFLKRNTSFLFNKLHLSKIGRRKPNLESTRKIFSSGGKTLSPTSQMGSMISTLTLPNTPSSPPTAYEFIKTTQQPQQSQQVYKHNVQRRNMDGTLPYEVGILLFDCSSFTTNSCWEQAIFLSKGYQNFFDCKPRLL